MVRAHGGSRMKRESRFLPPRQTVVYAHTRRMLDETATNANSFALQIAELYLQSVAPDVRQTNFKLGEGDELIQALRHNGQILRRFMDGTIKSLPADLEDAWVMALPEPYRGDCERELAHRRGRWSTPELPSTGAGQAVGMSQLATDFAHLIEALAPALDDGRITAEDLPHARRILKESDDLMSAIITVRRMVTDVLPAGEQARLWGQGNTHG